MTVTQVVEEALRGYVPPAMPVTSGALVRRGPLLVLNTGGRVISLAEAEAVLQAVRNGDLDDD